MSKRIIEEHTAISATELKMDLGKYLDCVYDNHEVVIIEPPMTQINGCSLHAHICIIKVNKSWF